jgi:hypothetical protein
VCAFGSTTECFCKFLGKNGAHADGGAPSTTSSTSLMKLNAEFMLCKETREHAVWNFWVPFIFQVFLV